MTKLFQSNCRQGHLIMVDMDMADLEERLWVWLEEKHNEVYWDIEMHEGGSVKVTPSLITFSGDNGIYELEECVVDNI
tara:strand:+ start:6100 stop:6333 length:234 start_codon:yes stop_codon:yes gene_type:complete